MRNQAQLLRIIVLAVLAAAILAPAPAAAEDRTVAATEKMRTAEARLLKDVNRIRTQNGRKPLRLDQRTAHVARARSSDMAAKRYFAHVEPDGDDADRILDRRGIAATEVTENIGHTVGLSLREGLNRMANWWYHSPPHRVQMLAGDVNYVGIGIARRGGRFTYTAIFTRSRDKTCPRVVIDEATWQPNGDSADVAIDWHGIDPDLATGTAGIKRFDIEHLTSLGDWSRVEGDPQTSKRSFRASTTGEQGIRIRAVDKAGNVGPWTYTRVEVPETLPGWV